MKCMESRDEMLARHARELAALDSRWWEEWFTEDPFESASDYMDIAVNESKWIKNKLPTIIRKIGVTVLRQCNGNEYCVALTGGCVYNVIPSVIGVKLAGRTLAPGERVEL